MDDDLICAVGSRGRGKGEFTNPQVSISIRMSVVNGHPEHKNDYFDSWSNQLICL